MDMADTRIRAAEVVLESMATAIRVVQFRLRPAQTDAAVEYWLRKRGFERFATAITAAGIPFEGLCLLRPDDLVSMGLSLSDAQSVCLSVSSIRHGPDFSYGPLTHLPFCLLCLRMIWFGIWMRVVIESGYVQKKGEVLKQWRRRFISLTSDRRLHYFRDESSANTTEPLGSIDIASALSYVTCLFIHLILIDWLVIWVGLRRLKNIDRIALRLRLLGGCGC